MHIQEQKFVETFTKLLSIPSPPGFEGRMAQHVKTELETMGYHPEIDPSGNVVLSLPGRSPERSHIMLAAHIDEVAVVVRAIMDDGTLRVVRSGGMFPVKTGERPILFLGDTEDVLGVISLGSGHTGNLSFSGEWNDIPILTGMNPSALEAAGIRPGTPGVPSPEQRGPVFFGSEKERLIGAWTLDDRAGVAVLLEWLRNIKETGEMPLHPTTVAWTVHEEGGCLGAAVLTTRIRPDIFIAIDGTPWKPGDGHCVSEYPVSWSKDQKANYDQGLLARMRAAAREAGTDLQYAVLEKAYSDASTAYQIGATPRVGLIGHARYNSHGFEVARLAVFPAVIQTLTCLLSQPIDETPLANH